MPKKFKPYKKLETIPQTPILDSICVDGACNIRGDVEYKAVFTQSKSLIFKMGPLSGGSNNIAEFLAVVHALAHCKKNDITLPIYSDSMVAIKWLRAKKCRTKQPRNNTNHYLFALIERAEQWLVSNSNNNSVLMWYTRKWGDIPADYGRK